jgi:hypothetical protein
MSSNRPAPSSHSSTSWEIPCSSLVVLWLPKQSPIKIRGWEAIKEMSIHWRLKVIGDISKGIQLVALIRQVPCSVKLHSSTISVQRILVEKRQERTREVQSPSSRLRFCMHFLRPNGSPALEKDSAFCKERIPFRQQSLLECPTSRVPRRSLYLRLDSPYHHQLQITDGLNVLDQSPRIQ